MKLKFLIVFLLSTYTIAFAQENNIEEDESLSGQFDKIYRTSTSYQSYKVISKDRYQQLKINVLDSLQKSNNEIIRREKELNKEKTTVKTLNIELLKIKKELKTAQKKENSVSLFGASLNKTTYNLILWLVILSLTFGLSFFAFKFKRSNVLTKKAQLNLEDVEHEFEVHRKKSLEREQKLRRQLQDEINKQRGN